MRFADYETARVLNKIGYSGDYEYFVEEGNEYTSKDSLLIYDSMIPAPRYDDAAEFLRDFYNVLIVVDYDAERAARTTTAPSLRV